MALETTNFLDYVVKNIKNNIVNYMTSSLLKHYNPDINGYTLIFFIPPVLSGMNINQQDFIKGGITSYKDDTTFEKLNNLSKFMTFAAVDFTPPQEQVNTDKIASRSGAIPFVTEVMTSEQIMVTYIDNVDLSIYKFHQIWLYYMWEIIEGKIAPSEQFYQYTNDNNANYGAIDYAGAFYIVKYKPDMQTMTYIGKCIGVFPQSLPSKELIGQRTSNELTTLPFNYLCAAYRAEVTTEGHGGWIKEEFDQLVASTFNEAGTQ